jgi:soluble lytic murein transglycosylase-like protein
VAIRILHHIGQITAALLLTTPVVAGEYAVLTNGFRIHADRHEIEGGRIRLFANGGVTEMATTDVASFEHEEITLPSLDVPKSAATATVATPQKDLYQAAAEKHGLPPALVRSVVKAESNFHQDAVSPKGAVGLMQLMPGTAKELGVDPAVAEQNVDGGSQYLRDLLVKYGDKDDQVARAVAAYNAGPGAVDKYNGVPPYAETQTYVRRVLRDYVKAAPQQ